MLQQVQQNAARPGNGITAQEYYSTQFNPLLRLPQHNALPNVSSASPMLLVRPQPPAMSLNQQLIHQQAMARRASEGHNTQLLPTQNVALPPQFAALAAAQARTQGVQARRLVLPTTSQIPTAASAPVPSITTQPTVSSSNSVCAGRPAGCGPDDERYQAFLSTVRQLQQHMTAFAAVFPVTQAPQNEKSKQEEVKPGSQSETRETASHEL
jgi:hypothetical protein